MPPTTELPVNPATADRFVRGLYGEHAIAVHTFILRMIGDYQIAEDVLQETMLRAWRHADRLQANEGSMRSWLFTVARNIAIDKIRVRQAHPVGLVEEHAGEPLGDHADIVATAVLVRAAINRLDGGHRAALYQFYYHDRTAAEAGIQLRIPTGTVKSRLFSAIRQLRALLNQR